MFQSCAVCGYSVFMIALVKPKVFGGEVRVPASKSHTIRRLVIASLAGGVSQIEFPLDSLDTRSCVSVCRVLGAEIEEHREKTLIKYTVRGLGKTGLDAAPHNAEPLRADVGNSGTTLYFGMAAAGLFSRETLFDGDEQIRARPAAPLIEALQAFGVRAWPERGNGRAPVRIQGPWKGGRAALSCPTSQYLSALLIAAPLAPAGTAAVIETPLLNERPYIEMTLSYLEAHGIPHEKNAGFSFFRIPGGASWKAAEGPVPGDFSSAAFPACAAVLSGGVVTLLGLDPRDTQGDKAIFDMLEKMGREVRWEETDGQYAVTVKGGRLKGGVFDLNETPDMLPAAAVLAAGAEGRVELRNVAHARLKETDRIAVMAAELAKLGVKREEKPDGLVIWGTGKPLRGGRIDSHGDHRVALAFAAAARGAAAPIEIEGAQCAAVTYPSFMEMVEAQTLEERPFEKDAAPPAK